MSVRVRVRCVCVYPVCVCVCVCVVQDLWKRCHAAAPICSANDLSPIVDGLEGNARAACLSLTVKITEFGAGRGEAPNPIETCECLTALNDATASRFQCRIDERDEGGTVHAYWQQCQSATQECDVAALALPMLKLKGEKLQACVSLQDKANAWAAGGPVGLRRAALCTCVAHPVWHPV